MARYSSNRSCTYSKLLKPALFLVATILVLKMFYGGSSTVENQETEKSLYRDNLKPEHHRRQLRAQVQLGRLGDNYQNIAKEKETEKFVMGPVANLEIKPLADRENPTSKVDSNLPCAWVPVNRNESPRHYPTRVLKYLGYHIRYRGEDFTPCHIIWTFEYPFWEKCWSKDLVEYVTKHLKRHQKVNHLPGIGFVANKATLARDGCRHCPSAFVLPEQKDQFLRQVKQYPKWQWVVKDLSHRGIKFVKTGDVNLNQPGLVQYFVPNPLLIDGRKFDFSVYVVIISMNPLRVYMYDADWAARFCKTPYEPFDPSDTSKYVVYGVDHIPLWKMDSLKESWNRGYGFKKSLLIHLKSRGYDADKLVDDVKHVIGSTVRDKERSMVETAEMVFTAHNDTRNLFELVRFDFIVDDKLKVYLMEVNMSPDLETDETNPRGQLYTNFLNDLYNMLGVEPVVPKTEVTERTLSLMEMMANIRTFNQECLDRGCQNNCRAEACMICSQCLKDIPETELHKSFAEHSYRRGFRRVVPEPFKSQEQARNWRRDQEPGFNYWFINDQQSFSWFRGKCMDDITWCN